MTCKVVGEFTLEDGRSFKVQAGRKYWEGITKHPNSKPIGAKFFVSMGLVWG